MAASACMQLVEARNQFATLNHLYEHVTGMEEELIRMRKKFAGVRK